MRVDELYGPGGYDPEHPSGNVLDAFEHHGERPDKGVTVKHYAGDGSVIVERRLSAEEVAFFFAKDLGAEVPDEEDVLRLRLEHDESVHGRIRAS